MCSRSSLASRPLTLPPTGLHPSEYVVCGLTWMETLQYCSRPLLTCFLSIIPPQDYIHVTPNGVMFVKRKVCDPLTPCGCRDCNT